MPAVPKTSAIRRARRLVAAVALLFVAVAGGGAGPSAAQEGEAPWPMVGRDPAHGGTASQGPAPPYREAWGTEVPGGPRGGPVVAGGAVVVVGGSSVVALEAGTGQARWEALRSEGPAGPPAVAGDLVIHASGRGHRAQVVARRVEDGREVWRFFAEGAPLGGPAVDADRVYLGLRTGFVVALDAGTGEEAWRYRTPGRVETSPAVGDGTVVAVSEDLGEGVATVHAVDAATGEREWVFAPPGFSLRPWGLGIAGDVAVVGMGDGLIHALALASGEERWSNRVFSVGPAGPMTPGVVPALPDDVVITDGLHVYRLDAATGRERWSFRLEGGLTRASPAVTGRTVLVGDDTGLASAIDLETGERVWRADLGDGPAGPVAVDRDRLYVVLQGTDGRVIGLEHDPGGTLTREESATVLDPIRAGLNFAAAGALVGLALLALFRFGLPRLGRVRGPSGEEEG